MSMVARLRGPDLEVLSRGVIQSGCFRRITLVLIRRIYGKEGDSIEGYCSEVGEVPYGDLHQRSSWKSGQKRLDSAYIFKDRGVKNIF